MAANHVHLQAHSGQSIREFYRDRCVFVTGATGFMGKVLVEKLLRACPQIRTVYCLMRPKYNQDVRRRLEELCNARVFERLKKEYPDALSKLAPISGDITLPGMGIAASDMKLLTENVSVVFHSAATVKFDEALKCSVEMNVIGTRRLIDLCHKMSHLVAVVHVSTAYCNCNRQEINEIVYPTSVHPQKIVDAVQWMDESTIETLTPLLLGDRPNTYTFTKALAESMLLEECGSLPLAIVRPSIVAAAWKEPVPGWVDNLNGPTGLILGCGKGVIRTILCHSRMVADLVPVDIPINMMIAVAWYTATQRPNNVLVYNCTSGNINKLKWGELKDFCHHYLIQTPMNDVIWYPGGSFKDSKLYNDVCAVLVHFLPAYIVDVITYMSGKKPMFVKMQKKIRKALTALEYFTTHEWQFSNENLWMLFDAMSENERQLFNFDMRSLNWEEYLGQYCLGVKQYVLKEDPAMLPVAKRHLRRMMMVRQVAHLFGLFILWRAIMLRFPFARRLWYFLMSLALRLMKSVPLLTDHVRQTLV